MIVLLVAPMFVLGLLAWIGLRLFGDDDGRLQLGCDPHATPEQARWSLLMSGIGAGSLAREGIEGPPPATKAGGKAGAMEPKRRLRVIRSSR